MNTIGVRSAIGCKRCSLVVVLKTDAIVAAVRFGRRICLLGNILVLAPRGGDQQSPRKSVASPRTEPPPTISAIDASTLAGVVEVAGGSLLAAPTRLLVKQAARVLLSSTYPLVRPTEVWYPSRDESIFFLPRYQAPMSN